MTVIDTARAAVRHRRKSNPELYAEIARMERERGEFTCAYTRLATSYLALQDLFDQAGIDISGALEDKRVAEERADTAEERADEAERLRAEEHDELVMLRARVANLDPWSVPQIGARDIDPDDQATEPIDVRAIRAVHAEPWRSPVIRLDQAPFAAPSPVADVDPRSLSARFLAGERRVTVSGGPFAKAGA